ncbi:MAG: methyl-accepting chemotaxis protein [Fibrobacteres bacterium]|nr:methyl-accepting chemotaxis protein [Fibrobacterota bacterium]
MGEQPKFQRKHFFINKRLQIRYMISMLIPMLVLIAFIGLIMYYSQYRFVQATTQEMGRDLKNVILTNQLYAPNDDCAKDAKTVADIKSRIAQYSVGDRSFSGPLLKTAYKILFIGLFVVVAELAFLTIFISHKVAGPVYRFSKFAEDLKTGNLKGRIYLRKGDELTDVASDFNQSADFLQAEVRALITTSENMIEEMKKGGVVSQDNILKFERQLETSKKRFTV